MKMCVCEHLISDKYQKHAGKSAQSKTPSNTISRTYTYKHTVCVCRPDDKLFCRNLLPAARCVYF